MNKKNLNYDVIITKYREKYPNHTEYKLSKVMFKEGVSISRSTIYTRFKQWKK